MQAVTLQGNMPPVGKLILDLPKIEAGKMDVTSQQVVVLPLISEIAETTRGLVGNKPVMVEVSAPDLPVMITTDPVMLRQIVMNLVSNAAKFTESGKIIITLAIAGSQMEISISDTGIGIKEEDFDKLFTVFSQIEDVKTKTHQGTGLGLAISKNLAELIGGSISLTSDFGKGTTFTVSLPLQNIERRGLYDTE